MSHATRRTDWIKHNREVLKSRKCTEYIVVLHGSDLDMIIAYFSTSYQQHIIRAVALKLNKTNKQNSDPLGNEGRCGAAGPSGRP